MRKKMLWTCVSMPTFDRFIFYIPPLYEFSHGLVRWDERTGAFAACPISSHALRGL
jgi:hypothetical protein